MLPQYSNINLQYFLHHPVVLVSSGMTVGSTNLEANKFPTSSPAD